MAYLIAAIVITLRVLEGHFPIANCNPFQVQYLVFAARRMIPVHLQSFLYTVAWKEF